MKTLAPPLFESAFLHEVATAIERRGKAIRYHSSLKCSRDVGESGECLKVEHTGLFRISVRLFIWSDGAIWLSVTQPGPNRTGGWALHHELRSHVAEFDGPEVCRRFERTIARPRNATSLWPTF
jgi:hypothetical protein